MKEHQIELLAKVGILVTKLEYEHEAINLDGLQGADRDAMVPTTIMGQFAIDEERFGPMCYLIELVDKICESKNPMVNEQFNHLITLLELTKE